LWALRASGVLQQGKVQRPPCRTKAAELEELRVVASRFYDGAVLALAQGVHRAKSEIQDPCGKSSGAASSHWRF
jgi:hypothetical protein